MKKIIPFLLLIATISCTTEESSAPVWPFSSSAFGKGAITQIDVYNLTHKGDTLTIENQVFSNGKIYSIRYESPFLDWPLGTVYFKYRGDSAFLTMDTLEVAYYWNDDQSILLQDNGIQIDTPNLNLFNAFEIQDPTYDMKYPVRDEQDNWTERTSSMDRIFRVIQYASREE